MAGPEQVKELEGQAKGMEEAEAAEEMEVQVKELEVQVKETEVQEQEALAVSLREVLLFPALSMRADLSAVELEVPEDGEASAAGPEPGILE